MKKLRKSKRLKKLWLFLCFLGHPAAGMLTVLGAIHFHPLLWFVGPAGFVGYQIYENWFLKDKGWREIRDYWIGFWGTVAVLLIMRLITLAG